MPLKSYFSDNNVITNEDSGRIWKQVWKSIPFVIILLFFSFFYKVTSLFPKCSDDFLYSFVWGNGYQRVEGIADILTSQAKHYMTWGGRFWTHSVVQFILMYDKAIFNILNLVFYALCAYFISRIMRPAFSLWRWSLVSISLWYFMPAIGSTTFWLTGSINYLWASFLNVLFLYAVYTGKRIPSAAMCLLSIIAGNAHEGIAAGIVVILIGLLILRKRKRRQYLLFTAIYALGFLLNALAPGNYMRMANAPGIDSIGLFSMDYLAKMYISTKKLILLLVSQRNLQQIFLLLFIALVTAFRILRSNKRKAIIIIVFVLGALASLSLNVISGTIYPRAMYGLFLISFILFGILVSTILRVRYHKYIAAILLPALIFINTTAIPQAYAAISTLRQTIVDITEESLKGNSLIKYPETLDAVNGEYLELWGIGDNLMENRPLAKYHGGTDFSVLKEEKYTLVQNILEQIQNIQQNTITDLEDDYHVIRLTEAPTKVSVELPPKELPYRLTFVREYTQKQPRGPGWFVICSGSNYYILWKTPETDSKATITFFDENVLTLPLSDTKKVPETNSNTQKACLK